MDKDNNYYHIKMAAWKELQDAVRMSRINDELLEYLASSLRYLLHYSKKYNIILPEEEKITRIMDRVLDIVEGLPSAPAPTRNQQHFKHEDDSTEPAILDLDNSIAKILDILTEKTKILN